jgi:hypothetical protein
VAAILPRPKELMSVGRGEDHGAAILWDDGCTCANWGVENLSLEVRSVGRRVLRVGRVGARGGDWAECWVLKREAEVRLDNNRVMRMGREPWWTERSEGRQPSCLDRDDVDPIRCRL